MSNETFPSRLSKVRPPEPPERLRAAALGAAERHWGVRPDAWTRLWESRPARLAWAGAVLVLMASHGLISMSRPRPDVGVVPTTLAHSGEVELDEIGDVRQIRIARFGWLTEGLSSRPASRPRRSPHTDKETP
jgi:hypothetical protein